jgi:hypothetical protein
VRVSLAIATDSHQHPDSEAAQANVAPQDSHVFGVGGTDSTPDYSGLVMIPQAMRGGAAAVT